MVGKTDLHQGGVEEGGIDEGGVEEGGVDDLLPLRGTLSS